MGQDMMSGAFGVFISLLVLVLLILWFFLPFAVFGIKDRLDKLIEQNRKLISLLENSQSQVSRDRLENRDSQTASTHGHTDHG